MANTVTCTDCGMSEELDNDNGLVYLSRKYNCYLDQVCEVNRRIKDGELSMDSNGHLVYPDQVRGYTKHVIHYDDVLFNDKPGDKETGK